jgi:hypothetical protein
LNGFHCLGECWFDFENDAVGGFERDHVWWSHWFLGLARVRVWIEREKLCLWLILFQFIEEIFFYTINLM